MRTFKKALAVVLATAMAATAVPAQAAIKPALSATKTMTAGKKGRAMSEAKVKKYKKAGYTLKFASSKTKVATINSKTGVIKAIKAGSKTNITCKFVKKGTKTVTKKMKLTVRAAEEQTTGFSVTQTGAKEFTITGEGLTAESIKVTRGSNDVAIETPVISADGTKAIVTTSGRLTEATYTVTAGEKSQDVTCVVSEPTTVEVGDKISSTEKITDYMKQYDGQFTFVVRNQWGEDVTKTVSPTINVNGKNASYKQNPNGDGCIATAPEVIFPQTMSIGTATITANIFDTTYPKINTNKALVVSDLPQTKAITFTEIYNAEGEAFAARAKGTFYYLFDLVNVDDVKIVDTKDPIFDNVRIFVNPGLTNLSSTADDYTSNDIIQIEKADGTVSLGVELKVAMGKELAAGTGTIQMMDLTSGVQGTGNIEIGDGSVVKSFSAAPDGDVVKGEDAEFSFTATDAAGNAVTDLASLQALLDNSASATGFRFQKEGTTVKLYYNKPDDTVGPHYATFTTEGYTSTTSVNFTVKAAARPTAIIGIRDAGKGALVSDETGVEYALKNLIFEDQYGRTMSKATAAAKMAIGDTDGGENGQGNGAYKVLVTNESANATNVKLNNSEVTTADITTATGSKVTVKAEKAATSKLSFKIVRASDGKDIVFQNTQDQYDRKQANVTNSSEYSINFVGANESSITSYTVDAPDMLYARGKTEAGYEAYTADVDVYGKVGSTQIQLPVTGYDITVQEAEDLMGASTAELTAKSGIDTSVAGKITGNVDQYWYNATRSSRITSAKRVLEINVNGSNPQTIEKEITLSEATPVVKNAYFVDENSGNEVNYQVVGRDVANVLTKVYTVDQYGVDTGDDEYQEQYPTKVNVSAARLTVSEINAAQLNASVTGNGTSKPTLEHFTTGDTFTLKITFQGGYTKTISCSYQA